MKLVFDSATLLAALTASAGASRYLLTRIMDGRATLCAVAPLWRDYEKLCLQPASLTLAGLNRADMEILLHGLLAKTELVAFSHAWKPLMKDPHDDLVMASLLYGQADAVITLRRTVFGDACRPLSIPPLSIPSMSIPVYSPGMAVATGLLE